jgi:energy-coupling factor transporter ATP-binding protein EcfA2
MKLTGFQITKYRNIIDSGWIDVDDIAALVGQNECGKSNLLIALSKLNSFDGHKYKMAEDWPIDLWAERDDSTVVCTAKFEFASADIADLHAAAQPPPPASKEGEPDPPPEVPWPGDLHMTVTRSYKNKHSFAFSSELPAGHKTQKAEEWAAKTLPKCVYMDDRVKKQAKEQTQRAYDTNASSRHLSSQFKDRWNQKRVKFDIRVDGPHLNIFVEDTGLEAFVPMEARSRGFQWYVSFVWRFTHASKGQYENCILLLDEPGVHLHHAGHADLLTFMEILAETNTVVYTTHLATMLDLAYPERLRIMEVHDHHASVIKSMVSSQDKPMMVIEAALNLAGGRSGLLGNRQNLIVEGGQDAVILHKLSGVLRNSGEEGLSDRVYLLPARGAPNTPMYAGFMVGNGWDAGVLLDADSAGEEARKKIK